MKEKMKSPQGVGKSKIVLVGLAGAAVFTLLILLLTGSSRGRDRLFEDQTYHFEALRVLGYASSGGAEINEVLQTLERIEENDDESWYQEWMNTAQRVEQIAQNLTDDSRGRGLALARAHNYYRAAEFFMPREDERKEAVTQKVYDTFYRSLDTLEVDYRPFQVPYGDSYLPAIYYPSERPELNKPLIVGICGYDSIQEELYYTFVKACLERGYPVVTYDGPGQGAAIRKNGITMTHRWERPNSAVLDRVEELYGEQEGVILLGNSLGGILATRQRPMMSGCPGWLTTIFFTISS